MKMIIRNGTVYDGTGAEGSRADVFIEEGMIRAVGPGISAEGADVIDAAGLIVTPGFVDIHRHCDVAPMVRDDFGNAELAQGITSVVAGNCGLAPVPSGDAVRNEMYDFIEPVIGPVPENMVFRNYRDYTSAIKKAGLPVNMGFFAAAGAIKTAVKGFTSSPYTKREIDQAAGYVKEAFEEGALGISLGIMYQPEVYSTAEEIAAVIRPAAEYNGLLTTHIRGEGNSLVASAEEVIRIADMAGLRLNISHFKATGIKNWRSSIFKAIECIEKARARGQMVTADFYPYDGGSTTMLSLLPPTMTAGGNSELFRRLAAPGGRAWAVEEINREHDGWDNMVLSIGWDRILISSVTRPEYAACSGKTVLKVSEELGYKDPAEFAADIIAAEQGKVGIIVLSMSQDDIDDIARLPWTALISDSLYGGGDNPHPRHYGSFPKFLREYVMERNVLPLPRAINKMTWMPAERAGIKGRGKIEQGFHADIAMFDPHAFRDTATYTSPKHIAEGMDRILLDGKTVWHGSMNKGIKAGALLRL